ncbi:carboxypeptidase-like regulatory domain-containing protein [Prevotella sp. P6B1]|uniref:M56 family metallopeptidase n=1 Tax=Prevotella sp. P6B1 TaxID=1410613 RepID=UPI0009DD794D|nr:M56 family metallopeptidase [Prevotella sp. P6B1]
MITAFLLYIGKVAILLAVFYLFYRLLMERETFHRFNRAILLLSVLIAFILPLCEITLHKTVVAASMSVSSSNVKAGIVSDSPSATYGNPLLWLFLVYLAGVVLKLLHTAISIYRLNKLISHCEQHPQADGTTIAVCAQNIAPFSWWNTIVFSRRDYQLQDSALLVHERAHINSYHSFDLLLMELAIALQWFNPAIWLIGSELRAVHEYEADASVLSGGVDAHHYLNLLMDRANAKLECKLANAISQQTLKKRFQMMARHRSKPSRLLKVLYLLPVVAITLALNAQTIIHYQAPELDSSHLVTDTIQAQAPQKVVPAPVVQSHKQPSTQNTEPQLETALLTISGTVVDEEGNPLPGTAVKVYDGTTGTITDFDGKFSLKVPKGTVVDFLNIGVATVSIQVKSDMTDQKIILKKDGSN